MKKIVLSFYCITLLAFCQHFPCYAVTETQKTAIVGNCSTIKENLKAVQKSDARARVYLGQYYETVLDKFIVPLNMRLVENNVSDNGLMENQSNFVKTRMNFTVDFIEYQKMLEDLTAIDCRANPEQFYEKLEQARVKREIVAEDAAKMRDLTEKQLLLATKLGEEL